MSTALRRQNALPVLKRGLIVGMICSSMVSCRQLTPVAITAVPTTAQPTIVTVKVPIDVTHEVTRQMIVTQEVTRQVLVEIVVNQTVEVTRLVPVTVTPPPPPLRPADPWSITGVMSMPRTLHAATLLADGRILLSSGYIGRDSDTTSAEIYDPITRNFSATGSLNAARHDTSATFLQDGRVLLIAGYGNSNWLTSAEIFDPATGQWSLTQPLFAHGVEHTATLLYDGRVLVMGGADRSGPAGPDDRVEIFDPRTSSWQTAAPHFNTEASHTATLLTDGRVLVAGGGADPSIYDPVTDTWQPAGQLATNRWSARAVRLQDGRVLLIGGRLIPEDETVINSAEIYDPARNTWQPAAPMAQARYEFTATLLPDGRVLVVGGARLHDTSWNDPAAILNSVEIYDPVNNVWSNLPPLQQARAEHAANLLPDGTVLVTGGVASSDAILDSIELLNFAGR